MDDDQDISLDGIDALDGFEQYVNSLGDLTAGIDDNPDAFNTLLKEYGKNDINPTTGKVNQAVVQGIVNKTGINSVSSLKGYRTQLETIKQQDEADSAWAYSIDQAQRLFGEGIQTIGDSLSGNYFQDLDWLGKHAQRIGANIVRQQDTDIKAGRYQPTFKGGFLEQESLTDQGGWVLEKLMENWASSGLVLAGGAAAVATAPVSGPAALLLGGATFAGATTLGVGEVSSELKDKNVYDPDDASKAVAVGLVIGALDTIGATKLLPKGALLSTLAGKGVIDNVAADVAKSGIIKEVGKGIVIEGLTEAAQEGIMMSYAASQGADYNEGEVFNRVIDSLIIGGIMGGTVHGSLSTASEIKNRITELRKSGQEPDLRTLAALNQQLINADSTSATSSEPSTPAADTNLITPEIREQLRQNNTQTDSNNNPVGTPTGTGRISDFISTGEGDYQSYNKGIAGDSPDKIDFSQMTVGELMQRQSLPKGHPDRVFAFGKSQIIPATMADAVKALNISPNERVTPELQERIVSDYLLRDKRPPIMNYIEGRSDNLEAAQIAMAQEWRSIADPRTGLTYADAGAAAGGNKASISADDSGKVLTEARNTYLAAINKGASPDEAWSQAVGTISLPSKTTVSNNAYRGVSTRITDAQNKKLPITYEVVEASSLIPSQDVADNQFRDRTRSALKDQVESIASNPDFDLLGAAPRMTDGAPVLTIDNTIIAGNGRSFGLREAYQRGTANAYKQELINNAGTFGIDPAAIAEMNQPVLIRRLDQEVGNLRLSAIQSNISGSAGMSSVEQARVDAEYIGHLNDFAPNIDGPLTAKDVIPLYQRIMTNIKGTGEENNYQDANTKQISEQGFDRIKNAVAFMAYGDTEAFKKLVGSVDVQSTNLYKGLMAAAPVVAELRDSIKQGIVYDADITDSLLSAVSLFPQVKASPQKTVDNWLSQKDAFMDISEETKDILRKLEMTSNSPNGIRNFMVTYAELLKAYGNPNQASLLGAVVPSKSEILQRTIEVTNPNDTRSTGAGTGEATSSSPANNESSATTGTEPTVTGFNQESPELNNQRAFGTVPDITPITGESSPSKSNANPLVPKTDATIPPPTPVTNTNDIAGGIIDPSTGAYPLIGSQPTATSAANPDWEKVAKYDNTNKPGLLDRVKSTLKQWLGSKVRVYGVQATQAYERFQAVPNHAKRTIALRDQQWRDIEKNEGAVTDDLRSNIYEYLINKRNFNLPPTWVGYVDALRNDIDSRSEKMQEVIRADASRRAGYELTLADLAGAKFRDVLDADGNVVRTADEIKADLEAASRAVKIIQDNMGRYVTRTYAIHTHPESWMKNIIENNDDSLPYKAIREKALTEYFGPQIIKSNPEYTTDEVESQAYQDMINFLRNRSGSSQEGLLQGRQVLLEKYPVLRELLGEHTDPQVTYANSIMRMDEVIGLKSFYDELTKSPLQVFDNQDAEGNLREIRVGKGDVFNNPFYGKFADEPTARFIENTLGEDGYHPWIKAMSKVNGLWQLFTVPLSLPTSASNIVSIIPVMIATASINPKNISYVMQGMKEIFWRQDLSKFEEDSFKDRFGYSPKEVFNWMSQNQITHGGALETAIELYRKESGIDGVFDRIFLDKPDSLLKRSFKAVTGTGKAAMDLALQVYAAGDSLPKMSIFLNELKNQAELSSRYGDDVIVNGMDRASHLAKQQAPQYSRIPQIVDFFRKAPTHGTFVAFKAQLYQTTYNQFRINLAMLRPEANKEWLLDHMGINLDGAKSDADRASLIADIRNRGIIKISSLLMVLTGYSAMIGAVLSLLMSDDEPSEDELKAAQNLMPEYLRFNDKAYIGRDEYDNLRFINTGRMDMYGDLRAAIRIPFAYMNGEIPDINKAAESLAANVASPFYSPKFVSRIISLSQTGQDDFGKAIVRGEDGFIGNVANVVTYLGNELFTNGTTRVIGDIYRDLVLDQEYNEKSGSPISAGDALMLASGMQVITLDPKRQASFWFSVANREDAGLRQRLSGQLKSYRALDDDALESIVTNAKSFHEKNYATLLTKIDSATTLGLSSTDLYVALKLSGYSDKEWKLYLRNGIIPPFTLNKIGDKNIKINRNRQMSESSRDTFEENYDRARDVLNGIN